MSYDNSLKAPSDYEKLSELYGSFLGALGGVSITVLSIVMAFNIEKGFRNDLLPYLIATLSTAAFSSFTGGHLMTETAAFISKSREDRTGVRLCAIATINIYISVALIIFSMVLMVVGLRLAGFYNESDDGSLTWFFIVLFAFVITSALAWMMLTIRTRLNMPCVNRPGEKMPWAALLPTVLFACLLSSAIWILILTTAKYVFSGTTFEHVLWGSLFLTVICTFLSLAYFIRTFERGDQFRRIDVYFFTSSIVLPCVSIVISCVQLLIFCKQGAENCY